MELLYPGSDDPVAGFQSIRHDDGVRRIARNGDLPPLNTLILCIDDPDRRLILDHRQRRRRNFDQRVGFQYHAPDNRRAQKHSRWRIGEFDFDLIVAGDWIGLWRYFADLPGRLDRRVVRKPNLDWLTQRQAVAHGLSGNIENRIAAALLGHLQDHLAGWHHLANFGPLFRDYAGGVGFELRVAQLFFGGFQSGLRRIQLRLRRL